MIPERGPQTVFLHSFKCTLCNAYYAMQNCKIEKMKIGKSQNGKIAKNNNCKIAKLQNNKIAKMQKCKHAKLKNNEQFQK